MAEKLKEYRKKRDFAKTAEPAGKVGRETGGKRRRFAVQYHIARRVHYDFRLEWKGVLLSWAVPKGPSYDPGDKRLAVMVEDHPLDYADFEGLIPKGQYGGGTVMLWDEGEWEPQTDFALGLKDGSLKIVLYGKRLKGKWALIRLKEKEELPGDNWLLIKENDEYVQDGDGISAFTKSVKTGRTTAEIEREEGEASKKNPTDAVDIQLAKLSETVPDEDGWLYEVKYDGYRIVAYTENGETRLMTRGDHDYTDKFRTVATALTGWADGRAMILDGEMVVPDENGRTNFHALQTYVKQPDGKDLRYMVFDLLALDGKDLRDAPLIRRKEKLAALMQGAPECLCYSGHVDGRGRESLEAAAELGLEGIVGKRADSVYGGDRNGDWIKIKCYRRQEFVVGGYTVSQKNTSGVSALLLGVYEGDALVYAGRAGTGIDRREAAALVKAFKGLKISGCPFTRTPKDKNGEKLIWLKPKLVAEVQFAEWTADNRLRQASFKGLRTDKDAEDVVMERADSGESPAKKPKRAAAAKDKKSAAKPEEKAVKASEKSSDTAVPKKAPANKKGDAPELCGVTISNPDRPVFVSPAVSKLEVIRYYERAAARMLPYAGGRVLSVVRCHKGVTGGCFFKKHPATESYAVVVVPVTNSEGKTLDYFYIENRRGLIAEAQLGTLEFHIWGSRVDALEKPDMMVFDLDPDEGMALETVRQGVRDLKRVLDELSLVSFLKTSGGKGYHVVVPLKPTVGWDAFHDFARQVAELMESRWPDRYTTNIRKIKRKGKIFIDWVRNGRGATSVAPYSLRARPGAKVSMPISWRELNTVAPDGVDIFDAIERLGKSDPWKKFFTTEQQLKPQGGERQVRLSGKRAANKNRENAESP